jgi:hypothetical protein
MSSTRLKNSQKMYQREQISHHTNYNLIHNKDKIINKNTSLPCLGINMGFMPNGLNNNMLSNNGMDIESELFGIGTTNLVQPKAKVCGQMNELSYLKFFEIKPESNNTIPETLVLDNNRRHDIFRR